jgi:predicted dehydrogenase
MPPVRSVRWALVGCGDIAEKRVVSAIQTARNSELSACIRRDSARLQEFQLRHRIPKGYVDYMELLSDPEIDSVYVATPVVNHCWQTIQAAEHGKHVLCEKPMAMTVAECHRMVDACRRNEVKLGVSYYRRFYPVVLKIEELLNGGVLGELLLVRTTLVEHTKPGDLRPLAWRFIPEQAGGGLLMDMASHRLDVLVMLFGLPRSVAAFTNTRILKIPVEDTGSLLMCYSSGLQVMTFASHCIQPPLDDFEVFGTKGQLKVGPLNGPELQVTTDHIEILNLPKAENAHLPLVNDFNRAVLENSTPRISGEEGLKASIILEAAYQSAREGRVIEVGLMT